MSDDVVVSCRIFTSEATHKNFVRIRQCLFHHLIEALRNLTGLQNHTCTSLLPFPCLPKLRAFALSLIFTMPAIIYSLNNNQKGCLIDDERPRANGNNDLQTLQQLWIPPACDVLGETVLQAPPRPVNAALQQTLRATDSQFLPIPEWCRGWQRDKIQLPLLHGQAKEGNGAGLAVLDRWSEAAGGLDMAQGAACLKGRYIQRVLKIDMLVSRSTQNWAGQGQHCGPCLARPELTWMRTVAAQLALLSCPAGPRRITWPATHALHRQRWGQLECKVLKQYCQLDLHQIHHVEYLMASMAAWCGCNVVIKIANRLTYHKCLPLCWVFSWII